MVLPRQYLYDLAFGKQPMIKADSGLKAEQVQIASVDCTLRGPAYRVRAAELPQQETVQELIERNRWYDFSLTGDRTHVLERGATYIIPLAESLALPDDMWAEFSPKSSTGRCDVFVRVLTDRYAHYDRTAVGYRGRLYLEITPLSFNVRVQQGLSLTQFRVRSQTSRRVTREELMRFHARYGIMRDRDGVPLPHEALRANGGGLYYHVDLDRVIVGFESLASPGEELDLTQDAVHDPDDFWRPIVRPKDRRLILTPGHFYLLATAERTVIPPEICGQILPYEISSGEFRPHYAGFFDNGFGGEGGTVGVLEVRCRDVPCSLRHGHPVCRMDFEFTTEVPEMLYKGNYTGSGPSLSKHFKRRYEVWGS